MAENQNVKVSRGKEINTMNKMRNNNLFNMKRFRLVLFKSLPGVLFTLSE